MSSCPGARAPAPADRSQPRHAREQPAPQAHEVHRPRHPAERARLGLRAGARARARTGLAGLVMPSLYWRIVLAFWVALALILVGPVTVAVNATAHRTDRPWVQRGQLYAQAARAFESGGPAALRSWLQSLPAEPFGRSFVVEPGGRELLGRPLPPSLSGTRDAAAAIAPIGGALVLVAAGGNTYHVVIGPVRGSPRLFGELELPGVPLAVLAIALGVSAAVCFFLARYLASPVDRLRLATRQMAGGDLNVRVLPALKGRQDDLGLLAADLDTMAERLQLQLEAKQQLLRDVSHELRSPLARLQLALSLARREGGGVERHLARIECEAQRLEALIARTLKLVRLERPVHGPEQASVDVGELLRTIAADVAIEADAQGGLMQAQAQGPLPVSGDGELLRSAFENVIRNAVRYSPAHAMVGVTARLMAGEEQQGDLVEDAAPDSRPRAPEEELRAHFGPFYP